jgi:hypothetical protein
VKPPPFAHDGARRVEETLAPLGKHGDDAKLLGDA